MFLVFFLFLSCLLSGCFAWGWHYRRKFFQLSYESSLEREILNSIAWGYLTDSGVGECSSSFREILSLSPYETINEASLRKIFNLEDIPLDISHPSSKEIKINNKLFELSIFYKKFNSKNFIIFTLFNIDYYQEALLNLLSHYKNLEKQNDQLRFLFDACPVALWQRDSEGRLIDCNLAYAEALETVPQRAINENLELVPSIMPHSPYRLSRKVQETFEKQKKRIYAILKGERKFIEIGEIPLGKSGGTIGYALDLTELVEKQRELEENLQAYHEVLNQLSASICIYNAQTELIFFNQSYIKTFNFQESWLHQKPQLNDVLERLRETRQVPDIADFKAYKKEQLDLFNSVFHPIHQLIYLPNGNTLRLVIAPHGLGGLIYIFEDITDKLALERGYNTLLAVQRTTLDHLYEGIMVWGTDHRLKLFNPSALLIWKMGKDICRLGTHINDFTSAIPVTLSQDRDWAHKFLEIMEKREETTEEISFEQDQWLEYNYVPLPDGSHLLKFVDISDQRRSKQMLQERNTALEQINYLKSQFISHVSYELKAPLNTISSFSEILLQQYFGALNERQLDYCSGIHESVERLSNLITNLLETASIEAGILTLQYEKVNLRNLLEGCFDLIRQRALDQGITLTFFYDTEIEHIMVDGKRIKHAILNLLTNAIKFTLHGGHILLEAKSSEDDEKIEIIVEDTGVGIPIEDKDKILQPFEKGKIKSSLNPGAGLGLSLAKNLIELHNGTIVVESQENQGTKITCLLPIIPNSEICFTTD